MSFLIDNSASVKNTRVFVEFPAREVVSEASILVAAPATPGQPDAAAAKIMIEGVSQSERFVLLQLPACMKSADVIRDVAGREPVLSALNLLLQTLCSTR